MLDVLTYLFYLLSKPNIPVNRFAAAKVQQINELCKYLYKYYANISYISLSTFLLIRDESGHARRDTVERSGRIFTRRISAEHWTSGGRGSSTRSSSHTRGSDEIREEGMNYL